jgi:hypothetical protein
VKRLDVVIAGETNMDLRLYGLPESLPSDDSIPASAGKGLES